jgi:hypothetical protein
MANAKSQDDDKITLSRRQAVTALGVGAVALTATHLGVAYEAGQLAKQAPEQAASDLAKEVEKLKGLVALYETLEKIGIDAIISGAMSVFKGFLDTLRGGVGLLRAGVSGAEGALNSFQNTFAAIRDGLKAAEDGVNNIAALLNNAEVFIGDATTPAKPLVEQVRQFFDDLLGKIPFGVGDNIRHAIDGIVGLVVAIPSGIAAVSSKLIQPLRTGWFSADSAKNIQGALLDPITQNVLEPLKKFLGDVDQTLAHWQGDVATPVQAALDQRDAVRKQIAQYKEQHNL